MELHESRGILRLRLDNLLFLRIILAEVAPIKICLSNNSVCKSGMENKKMVLMVCLGNSCRSPIAEAVFRNEAEKLNLNNFWGVDSASLLGYHVGNHPEPRAMAILQKAGILNYSHIGRQISIDDFYIFDWIFAMDSGILNDLCHMEPENGHAKIELLGIYDPEKEFNIRDPLFASII